MGEMWQLILGVILIIVVLLLPNGVIGTVKNIQYDRKHRKDLDIEV